MVVCSRARAGCSRSRRSLASFTCLSCSWVRALLAFSWQVCPAAVSHQPLPCPAVLAFVWSFGEWGAVWFARKYPATYKRMSELAERFWFQEQHHKNVTLSRRFSNLELPDSLPERSKHGKAAADELPRDLPSVQARHSRLGRSASGREEGSVRCAQQLGCSLCSACTLAAAAVSAAVSAACELLARWISQLAACAHAVWCV